MKLLIATRNIHKIKEIRAIFIQPSLELLSVADFAGLSEVEEDGNSFAANAVKKAAILAIEGKVWALADDSGLEVEALGGAPGVRSARYAGEPVDYSSNNRKLLKEMTGVSNRRACFRCAIALSSPSGRCQFVEGKCEGTITESPHGSNGFGYDPLFVPDGHTKTFAEMDDGLKNRISHRGLALNLAKEKWGFLFSREQSDWPKADWAV